jgi:aminodeoxyfutalosine synthase
VTEFHIVGGLHPDLPLRIFSRPGARAEAALSQGAHQGLHHGGGGVLARRAKLTIEADADEAARRGRGLDARRRRGDLCRRACGPSSATTRSTASEWLETARLAHKLGFKSNATMLYGHIENDEDRVDHLLKLRALQDETGGFQTFIPLAFHPENTPLDHLPVTTGLTDIRQIAVSRLLLDNFPHIKAYWQMLTPKIAQIALRFGADDLDGTVIEEKIYHDAGATTPQGMTRKELAA